jgi:hypothetical protein
LSSHPQQSTDESTGSRFASSSFAMRTDVSCDTPPALGDEGADMIAAGGSSAGGARKERRGGAAIDDLPGAKVKF